MSKVASSKILEWLDDVEAADREYIDRWFVGNKERMKRMREIRKSKRYFCALRRLVEHRPKVSRGR